MRPILFVENVSKKFNRHLHSHRDYGMTDLLREIFAKEKRTDLRPGEFWALRDLSFSLYPGESIGLVGRNGSGKSTLLKMINGSLRPDVGKIAVDGRVQALINLNAGLDPTLSGRENIFRTGALLGLSHKMIHEIMDDIVSFSEIHEFIESPVGTYSSGMKARLGFSVAVNLNPTILLIDEVLSVGDFAFQNKCLIKMHQLKNLGVAMVLVSHNATNIKQFCDRAIWIHKGVMKAVGNVDVVLKQYMDFLNNEEIQREKELVCLKKGAVATKPYKSPPLGDIYGPIFNEDGVIKEIQLELLLNGEKTQALPVNCKFELKYNISCHESYSNLKGVLVFYRKDGLQMSTLSIPAGGTGSAPPVFQNKLNVSNMMFNPGQYVMVFAVIQNQKYLYRDRAAEFAVLNGSGLTWGLLNFNYRYHVSKQSMEGAEFNKKEDRIKKPFLPKEIMNESPGSMWKQSALYGPIYEKMDMIDDLSVEFWIKGKPTTQIRVHDTVVIKYSFRLKVSVSSLNVSLNIVRDDGLLITTISTLNGDVVNHIHEGMVNCEVILPGFSLNPGNYSLVMPIHEGTSYLYRNLVKAFKVSGDLSSYGGIVSLTETRA